VVRRRGVGKLGCLVALLLAAAVAYFAIPVGEIYLRYYRFNDALEQEARFAARNDDDEIRRHLAAVADSLGLPDEALRIQVRRSANRITISNEWTERVDLPFFRREFHFAPRHEGPL
jgi:hypothetical protein